MADKRIFNFSAGPSMLPEQVLKTASEQMLNYKGSGMSVMEMSHRSSAYDQIIKDAQQRLRDLLQIPDNYKVLFLQGGASTQFAAIPMNLLRNGIADYVITGHFAKKAYEEAKKYGAVNVAATTEDEQFARIPKQEELKLHEDADYVYLCCNNTIYGTEWNYIPDTNGIPIVADHVQRYFVKTDRCQQIRADFCRCSEKYGHCRGNGCHCTGGSAWFL